MMNIPQRTLGKREHKRISRFIESAKPLLRLDNWEIKVSRDEFSEGDNWAEVTTQAEYRIATIVVSETWGDLDSEGKRRVITHELAHLVERPLHHIAAILEEVFRSQLTAAAWDLWWGLFSAEEERVADEVALMMLPHMPAWPE